MKQAGHALGCVAKKYWGTLYFEKDISSCNQVS